jgi:hypothetical protein
MAVPVVFSRVRGIVTALPSFPAASPHRGRTAGFPQSIPTIPRSRHTVPMTMACMLKGRIAGNCEVQFGSGGKGIAPLADHN